jgi:hypothetical protein
MNFRKYATVAFYARCAAFVLLAGTLSCSPKASLAITQSSALECEFSVSLESAAADMITSFSAQNGGRPAFQAGELTSNLKRRGFDSVTVTAASDTKVAFTAKSSDAQKVFAFAPKAISYLPKQGAKNGAFTMTVSPETAGEILALFPPSTADYLSLFLSPLLTPDSGGGTDERSYTNDIRVMYGSTVADALTKSVFVFSVDAPGAIVSMTLPPFAKAAKSGNRLTVTMPLAALLSITTPTIFGVSWN